MPKVNMLEAKTNLSKLVEAVETGKETEIILARNGKPVARIVPIRLEPRRLGLAEGKFGEFTREMADEWNRDNEKMWAEYLAKPLFPDKPAQQSGKRRKRV